MEPYGSCVRVPIRVEPMRLVKNLTQVKISDEQLEKANFNDGISINVFSEKPFTVNAYWIVNIDALYHDLDHMDWKSIRDSIWNKEFLKDGKSLLQNEPQIHYTTHEQVECTIKPPREIEMSKLTKLPRDFYPLVLFVTCFEEEANPNSSDAAANIQIIHIKDSIVPIRSHVIKQFSKHVDGRILDISKLYAEDVTTCMICLEESRDNLYCMLPCRHSSICFTCLKLITQCPICRAPILSVFNINAPASEPTDRPTIDPRISHLYDNHDGNDSQRQNNNNGFLATVKSWFGF